MKSALSRKLRVSDEYCDGWEPISGPVGGGGMQSAKLRWPAARPRGIPDKLTQWQWSRLDVLAGQVSHLQDKATKKEGKKEPTSWRRSTGLRKRGRDETYSPKFRQAAKARVASMFLFFSFFFSLKKKKKLDQSWGLFGFAYGRVYSISAQ